MNYKEENAKKMEYFLRKKFTVCFMFVFLFLVGISIGGIGAVSAAEGDNCISNFSNIRVSSSNGCSPQKVYQYCTFYSNFWNPKGNLQLRSATVTLKRNGTTVYTNTVWSRDNNHYFTYAYMPIKITRAGTYTVERSATTLNGGRISWDTTNLIVNAVEYCPANLSLAVNSLSLDMNGRNSRSFLYKMVDYLKKALIYGHTSRISS